MFSIITPSLNHYPFIKHTIDSVMEQTYNNLEYIILDGGSTDGTISILKEYGLRRKKIYWVSESDGGQAAAINHGINMSTGEIIAWLNADDVYLPETLEAVSNYFQQHPNIDIVYGDCDYIDETGKGLGRYQTAPYNYTNLIRIAVNYIPQPATFILKRVFKTTGLLDESLHYAMDYDYWLRAGVRHNIAFVPIKFARMRLHQRAKSIKNLNKFPEELITIYMKLFNMANLPAEIQKLEREALHNVFYRASHIAFWAGEPEASRQYANHALLHFFHIRSWILMLVANKFGIKLANLFKDNPYLPATGIFE